MSFRGFLLAVDDVYELKGCSKKAFDLRAQVSIWSAPLVLQIGLSQALETYNYKL